MADTANVTVISPADRFKIADLIQGNATALDSRDWEAWHRTFTPGALIDFSSAGIPPGRSPQIREILSAHDATRIGSQHLLGIPFVMPAEGHVNCRTEYRMVSIAAAADGWTTRNEIAGWYVDRVVKFNSVWLIAQRTLGLRWRWSQTLAPEKKEEQ